MRRIRELFATIGILAVVLAIMVEEWWTGEDADFGPFCRHCGADLSAGLGHHPTCEAFPELHGLGRSAFPPC